MYGRTELVPVRVFCQAVHIGSVFLAIINKAETMRNSYVSLVRSICYFQFNLLAARFCSYPDQLTID